MSARRADLPVASERTLQAAIGEQLAALLPPGCYVTAIPAGDGKVTRAPAYRSGSPDLLVLVRGIAIGLELKRDVRAKQSAAQREVERDWRLAGGVYAVCRTPEDAVAVVARFVPLRGRISA